MDIDLIKNLKDLGFQEREAKIFILLVERIEMTAYEISRAVSLPRTTVYQSLEKMILTGVVILGKKNGIKYYSAESLAKLADLVEQRKRALDLVLPKLKSLSSNSKLREPTSHVYIGIEATKIVWEQMLETYKNKGVGQSYGTSSSDIFTLYGNYFFEWVKKRRETKTHTMLIFPESDKNKLPIDIMENKEEVRFLPDEYLYSGEITVYGNNTAIFSFDKKQPYAIVIESPEIAEIFTKTFRLMWMVAK